MTMTMTRCGTVSRKEVERSAECYMTLASLPDEYCCHLDRHVTFTTDEKYEKLSFCVPPIIYSHTIGLCMAALQTALRAASGKSSAGREPSH